MPVPLAAELRPYKQVFEEDARCGVPRAVVVEVERHTRHSGGAIGRDEQGLGVTFAWIGGEGEGGTEGRFGGEDFVEGVFVGGELVY